MSRSRVITTRLIFAVIMLASLVLLFFAPMMLCGCGPATSRAEARGAINTAAEAVHVADEICAKTALEKENLPLATACSQAYDGARTYLLTASAAVDAWDEGKKGSVMCAVAGAMGQLSVIAKELRQNFVSMPRIIEDALFLMNQLASCPNPPSLDGGAP